MLISYYEAKAARLESKISVRLEGCILANSLV